MCIVNDSVSRVRLRTLLEVNGMFSGLRGPSPLNLSFNLRSTVQISFCHFRPIFEKRRRACYPDVKVKRVPLCLIHREKHPLLLLQSYLNLFVFVFFFFFTPFRRDCRSFRDQGRQGLRVHVLDTEGILYGHRNTM